ncbi:hypothetical protein BVX93_00965 [bacterium B13(2017)]|nr:hypothetical protein BVX93_00965 [bacterium B13(2017)]
MLNKEKKYNWILFSGFCSAFLFLLIEIFFYRLLEIFSNYITSNSIISIGILGSAFGGIIFFYCEKKNLKNVTLIVSFFIPLSILLVLFSINFIQATSILFALILMIPFIGIGCVLSYVYKFCDSHISYFIILLGSALGVLSANFLLKNFFEENSIFLVSAFSLLVAFSMNNASKANKVFNIFIVSLFIFLTCFTIFNKNLDVFNIIKWKVQQQYRRCQILFSRSSLAGRYDIIKSHPLEKYLLSYENGMYIDTIMDSVPEICKIDPRLPYNLIKHPKILIMGLSGDGITKVARSISKSIDGVEINPVVVNLHKNELVQFNGNCYDEINVKIIDGRSFIEQTANIYDIITFQNTHLSRGSPKGRAASPEYLYTKEALLKYFEHLSEKGFLIFEEPTFFNVTSERSLYKLLHTMRVMLLENGYKKPQNHFFVFHWTCNDSHYYQIILKKQPFLKEELKTIKKWLYEVDHIKEISKGKENLLGRIITTTTVLHEPNVKYQTNISNIIKGDIDNDFLKRFNIKPVVDDKPYMFDTNPRHPGIIKSYFKILILIIILFLVLIFCHFDFEVNNTLPLFLVVGLTGLGYMIVEIYLLQRFEIILGSPIVNFSCVVGTFLLSSGLGSLASYNFNREKLFCSLFITIIILFGFYFLNLQYFKLLIRLSFLSKIVITISSIGILGFFLGIPFPYVLKISKLQNNHAIVPLLYTSNAALSAIAVPLAFNYTTILGIRLTFLIGIVIYIIVLAILMSLHNKRITKIVINLSIIVIAIFLLFPIVQQIFVRYSIKEDNSPKVFALKYGESKFKYNEVFWEATKPNRKVDFSWMFWVIRHKNRIILVDTGFENENLKQRWKIKEYIHPVSLLKKINLTPDMITDVIITHIHLDHIECISKYRNAKIWIQKREFDYLKLLTNYYKRIYSDLMLAKIQQRLEIVNGEKEIAPGITILRVGGHSPGMQIVKVKSNEGNIIIASDTTYLYDNSYRHIPVGSSFDIKDNLNAIKKMHKIGGSLFFIIPGHDPFVFKAFPKITENVVKITMEN